MDEMEQEGNATGITKKFMYVNRRPPHGTIYALEGLEVVLMGAAFAQDVSMVFLDDGVFQLKKGQDTRASGMKNFSPAYRALEIHEVDKLYVEKTSLEARGLTADDLIVPVKVVSHFELAELMEQQDVILNF
ncbi:MAG: sulfurtransferase complex subunit TusC [Woeseiaceae bacterium]